MYRLKREEIRNDGGGKNGEIRYEYDEVGNRIRRESSVEGIENQEYEGDYDEGDRLMEGYRYDGNGNVIEDEEGWVYEYDAENKIIRAERGGEEIIYVYNGEGERVRKIKGGEEIRYLIDKENPTGYSQVIEERGSGGEVKRRYVYGYDLISMTDVSTNKTYYYVYDGIGSVRAVIDEGGNIVNEYDYDGFGVELYALENVENNYKFHGEYKDEDTGLYYLRARWYDVDTGRFYSMDEFEGVYEEPESLHKYVFAGNDGVNRVDYSGMYYGIASVGVAIGMAGILAAMPDVVYGTYLLPQPKSDIQKQLIVVIYLESSSSGWPKNGPGEVHEEKVAIGILFENRAIYADKYKSCREQLKFGDGKVYTAMKLGSDAFKVGRHKKFFMGERLKPNSEIKKLLKGETDVKHWNLSLKAALECPSNLPNKPIEYSILQGKPVYMNQVPKCQYYRGVLIGNKLGSHYFFEFESGLYEKKFK